MKLPIVAGAIFAGVLGLSAFTPAETRARAAAIRATSAAILQECQRYGGGDWNAWYKRLLPFRKALRPIADAAMVRVGPYRDDPTKVESPLLRVDTTPPIYELPGYAMYLFP